MLTVLLGGARSGKSALAVTLGRRHEAAGGTVVFVATAPQIEGDADWTARVDRHRAERPAWPLVEEPIDLTAAVAATDDDVLVIVDCLTLWVSNLMYRGDQVDDIAAAAVDLAGTIGRRRGPTIVVSNEVGFGIHPETALGRQYRDTLGTVNRIVASAADTTLLLVAGRAVRLDDPTALV